MKCRKCGDKYCAYEIDYTDTIRVGEVIVEDSGFINNDDAGMCSKCLIAGIGDGTIRGGTITLGAVRKSDD